MLNEHDKIQDINESENIANVENITAITNLYIRTFTPSLANGIFEVRTQKGPVSQLINLEEKTGGFKIIRKDAEVFETDPINTGITEEAIEDIIRQYGYSGVEIVVQLLKGLSSKKRNERAVTFLSTKSTMSPALTLTESTNSLVNLREITQKVHELVLKINENGYITYNHVAVIPQKWAAAFLAMARDSKDNFDLFAGKVNTGEYYINPDKDDSNVYVGLKKGAFSSGFLGEYTDDIVKATDPDTGEQKYFIYNRYSITESPLHANNPMWYKFAITN